MKSWKAGFQQQHLDLDLKHNTVPSISKRIKHLTDRAVSYSLDPTEFPQNEIEKKKSLQDDFRKMPKYQKCLNHLLGFDYVV